MDLATVEAGLLAWAAALTEAPSSLVVKANAARPIVPANAALVLLQWVSIARVGRDAVEWEYDAEAADAIEELTPNVVGVRRAVLQVDVETADQRSGVDAEAIAQRIVDRAEAPSSLAALDALNLGLASVGEVRRTDYPFDGRMVARATVEVVLNATSLYEDTAGRTATIERVEIGATVTGSGGTQLPDTVDSGGTFDGTL